jgi:hypothetical protein
MVDRTMTEVMDGLGSLLDELDAVCRYGFDTYRAYPANVLLEHDPRAAAACIYAHMAADAERRFLDHAQVKPVDPRPLGGLKIWRVGDLALIRFKKHDEDGNSRNYPTKQAKAYDRGDMLPGLPPPAVRVSVGYWLDPTNTVFYRTQVARPMGKLVSWNCAIIPPSLREEGSKRWMDVTRQGSFGG